MRFIDKPEDFAEVSAKILSADWAAVDTEADSLHHYVEKLCLIQISVPGEDYVIDPLAPLKLADFFRALSSRELIFHAADSDIRLIKKAARFSPKRIFDTMLAAQVLGYEKIGLQNLAERHCGVQLSKTEQKADWSERPLDEKLVRYAANDTHYLRTISEAMKEELAKLGRLEWHRQQCEKLLETLESLKPSENDPAVAWQIKGAKALSGKALTILKELWFWRDGLARKKDRPAFKVLNSEYLLEIAKWAAEHPHTDIGQWKNAPRNVQREHRDALNALLERADRLPQAVLESAPSATKRGGFGGKKRWTDRESRILGELKAVRDKHAAELKIHPSLIATNAVLETLASEKPRHASAFKSVGLLPWQIDIAGEDLLKKLSIP